MLKLNIQLFAHKKGQGSTKNGRDSESKRLGAKVEAKIVKQGKAKKIIVYKFKAKKKYRRTQGHRQPYTKVEITKISEK